MSGPLPNPQRRRRNAPTIQTTVLPAAGREGPAPESPYELGEDGRRWWEWAWRTPQATKWGAGSLFAVARRARLEDEKQVAAVLREMRELDKRLGLDPKALAELRWVIGEPEQSERTAPAPVRRLRAVDAA